MFTTSPRLAQSIPCSLAQTWKQRPFQCRKHGQFNIPVLQISKPFLVSKSRRTQSKFLLLGERNGRQSKIQVVWECRDQLCPQAQGGGTARDTALQGPGERDTQLSTLQQSPVPPQPSLGAVQPSPSLDKVREL